MYQWSLIEDKTDSYVRCLGVYDDFAMAVGQALLVIDENIKSHFYDECYSIDDYKISQLEPLEADAGYFITLSLNQTASGGNSEAHYRYCLLCSDK